MSRLVIFIPSIENGGVEKNLYLLLEYFSKKFKKINLVTTSSTLKNSRFKKNIKLIRPKLSTWNKKSRIYQYLICFYLLLKFFRNKKITILSFQANVFVIIASFFLNSKVIIRLNTSIDKYINNIFQKLFYKFFYSLADIIIVNSLSFKKILQNQLNLRSICIYNPIKLNTSKKKKINFFSKFKYLKILTIGRLTDQKDHMTLLKCGVLLKENNIHFKIYIIGQGYKYNELQEFIKTKKLTKYIKLAGYKPFASSYISSADLFVLTSKYEGLPNVLIESQKLKKPIISSNCNTGPKEILGNGKYGDLFKVGDYKDLFKKIKSFHNNKKILMKKSLLATKYLNRFNYEKNCFKYYSLIKKL